MEWPMKSYFRACLPMLMLPLLQSCSNSPPDAVSQATVAATAPPPQIAMPAPVSYADPHTACGLVTAAEMSAILGTVVTGTAKDADGATACSYAPTVGSGSSAQIMISWGDGESTLQMVRAMKDHDAAADLPYQGIGDDAVYEKPAVVVRQGKDLIGVAVFGAADLPAAVKKIIDTAKSKPDFASVPMNAVTDASDAGAGSGR